MARIPRRADSIGASNVHSGTFEIAKSEDGPLMLVEQIRASNSARSRQYLGKVNGTDDEWEIDDNATIWVEIAD